MMGDKAEARKQARAAGLPILQGSENPLESADEGLSLAKEVGYPVILKAAGGGGGRGMRIVREASELPKLLHQARHEAAVSFHSSDVYLEKYIVGPRHIEFQILGDNHGNVVALGERECSIQRRHQKLIEEAPSPRVDRETRQRMCRSLGRSVQPNRLRERRHR